jgi:phosphoribosylformylglycinamidine (FGAM) synthase PurS component
VLFYGVVSAQTEKVVEFFLERESAEGVTREVRVLAEELRVEAIGLD